MHFAPGAVAGRPVGSSAERFGNAHPDERRSAAALTEATWRQAADPRARAEARRHITEDPAAYPTLTASGHLDDARWSDDELFDQGLDTILATAPS